MAGYATNPGDLHAAAPRYDAVARGTRRIYDTLTRALEAEGACWGNDDAGRTFGRKYVPAALPALRQMSDTNQGIQSMVDGVCGWAKNYIDVDQQVRESAAAVAPDTRHG